MPNENGNGEQCCVINVCLNFTDATATDEFIEAMREIFQNICNGDNGNGNGDDD